MPLTGALAPMDSNRVSAVAAAVTLLAMAARWAPGWLLGRQIDGWVDGGGASVLPLLGSVGQTVTTYNYVVRAVELVAPLAIGVALGVWLARRVGNEELGAGLRAVAVGSAAVVALPVVGVVVWSGFDPGSLAMAFGMVLSLVAAGPVSITVAAAAGAMFETLGVFDDGSDEQPEGPADDTATVEHDHTA